MQRVDLPIPLIIPTFHRMSHGKGRKRTAPQKNAGCSQKHQRVAMNVDASEEASPSDKVIELSDDEVGEELHENLEA